MLSITLALITAATIGLYFTNTRTIGIAALAVLAALYPFHVLALTFIGGAIFLFIHWSKSP